MNKKLSELSKPVQIFKHPTGRNFWAVMADSTAGQNGVEPFYSQAYVSALLEDNERLASDLVARNGEIEGLRERAAELESYNVRLREWNAGLAQESCELKAKLATPVRLNKVDSSNVPFAGDGFNAAVDYCAKAVRAAGFKCAGDE